MLKLSDIRKPLKIDVQSPCVITRLGRIENRYDIKINETFIMNNNKYIVVLNKMLNCKDCSFNCRVECGSVKCAANERSDRKSVTFKKIP